MKKKVVVPAALATAVLAAGGLLYFMHVHALEKADATTAPPPSAPIVAGTVTQHDVPIYLTGVGTVIAYNTDVVRAQIQGQIISINFTEGQTVHAGDLLAQIDPRPYQALIDQYTGNLERDQAQLKNAQANLTRYTTLGDKGWATPQLIETQQAQVGELQAAIKAVQYERSRRRHAAASDFADIHAAGDESAANRAATGKDQDAARGPCLHPGRYDAAG
jgi:multidrug efflux system membrane fusion protein